MRLWAVRYETTTKLTEGRTSRKVLVLNYFEKTYLDESWRHLTTPISHSFSSSSAFFISQLGVLEGETRKARCTLVLWWTVMGFSHSSPVNIIMLERLRMLNAWYVRRVLNVAKFNYDLFGHGRRINKEGKSYCKGQINAHRKNWKFEKNLQSL